MTIMPSSSSDSDAGEKVKNVQSFLIRSRDGQQELDENCAYKRKLGDLIFDANFEGGNLGFVEQIDQYDYDLMVRPDVANLNHRLWFNFKVSNQRPNQCVVFTIVNLSDLNMMLFNEGLTPVVRTRLEPNWIRLHEDQVFYYRSPNHNGHRVLSIAFRFTCHDNEHQFALFYPYTHSTLINFISRWSVELKRNDCSNTPVNRTRVKIGSDVKCDIDELTKSTVSRSIHLIRISGRTTAISTMKRPKVIIVGRQAGNIDGAISFVCQGLVDFALSDDPVARVSRSLIDMVVFPMLDPDSVGVGNSQTDIFGQAIITPKVLEANPALYANYNMVREIIESACKANSRPRVIIIEMRVNLNLIGCRILGTHYDNSLRMERHSHFPRLLSTFLDGFYLEQCRFITLSQPFKSTFNFRSLPNVDQYRLEVSPFAFYKRSLTGSVYEKYDQPKYLLIGKAMVYSLLELLRPKRNQLPSSVETTLSSFLPKSSDIDDLTLYSRDELTS